MNLWETILTLQNMLIALGFILGIGGYLLGSMYKKIESLPQKVTLNIAILLIVLGVIILFVGYII